LFLISSYFFFRVKLKEDSGSCWEPDCNNCKIDKADRGWFERVHQDCKDAKDNPETDNCVPGVDSFELVMSFAVVCGVLWIVAGGVSFWASKQEKEKKMWAFISACIYIVGYIIFVGLFGGIMLQINENNHYLNRYCKDVRKKVRRSGDEFIGYSICGFVLIAGSIICTLASGLLLS